MQQTPSYLLNIWFEYIHSDDFFMLNTQNPAQTQGLNTGTLLKLKTKDLV
jgi:hypothetical protein